MSSEATNPYLPPPPIEPPIAPPSEAADALRALPRRNVLVMILLTVVTLGLYLNYWVHSVAVTLNRTTGKRIVSMGLVYAFWVLSIASILWTVPEVLMEEDGTVLFIGQVLYRGDMIFTLVMVFTLRSVLNRVQRTRSADPEHLRVVWTFLFGVYYLQWKLNRNLPDRESSRPMFAEEEASRSHEAKGHFSDDPPRSPTTDS